jgi:hypothetical protein
MKGVAWVFTQLGQDDHGTVIKDFSNGGPREVFEYKGSEFVRFRCLFLF